MMQAEPTPAALTIGVEVWSVVDREMVREAAAPSIGDLDRRIGQAQGQQVAALVEAVRTAKVPSIKPLTENGLCVLLWPVIDREQVTAVVTLYLDAGTQATCAAEIWTGRPGRSELCLGDTHYAGLDRFSKLSPFISFPKGSGLPGLTWETNIPQMIEGLGSSPNFMRATGAESEGLDIGFAIPCISGTSLQAVALLLSGSTVPAARVFETWLPAQQAGSLRLGLHEGVYVEAEAIKKSSRQLSVPAGDTWIGRAWATRMPAVVCDTTGASLERRGAEDDRLSYGLAIPIIVLDDVAAVAVMMW